MDQRGMFDKYKVSRRDGSSRKGKKHDGCEYFVLDWKHDKFAIPAARAYAAACAAEYPSLAVDLYARANYYEANPWTGKAPKATP